MRLALKLIASYLAILILPTPGAFAEGAFVQQATGAYQGRNVALPVAPNSATGGAPAWTAPKSGTLRAAPELATPASGGNFASTLEIGAYNKVFQAQLGAGNVSNVGIIKGYANSVGVLQAGNNLKSNLALINTQGLAVGVIQPNGSAPVNVLIARLPNGGLLIKR
ncbi:hypothetical protein [Bradyrhizobium australiense]|uniref:Minor curlin subunit n=1 Tax=Bradyrhizobium australiense TaxID=2721161 RepID=A0A7Y4GXT0_9BRAD|nr:hypothetical protein [Bradyrhizobium australiense]NOJ43673.1 hypothetical protein [Bradyrhizobium australiense]